MKLQFASDRFFQKEAERKMKVIGPSERVDRLLIKWGPVTTRKNYLTAIAQHLRGLRTKGVYLKPACLYRGRKGP
jgi:hypothetical protein